MKKILTGLGVTLFLCLCAILPVSASVIETYGINNDPQAQAEMLHSLHLLQGTGDDFALERGLTRAEAATLLVRVLGGEQDALSQPWAHPFTDVPAWADRYVGWFYAQKLTNGISADLFGSNRFISYWEFATMLTRACRDVPDGADPIDIGTGIFGSAEEIALCDAKGFIRADAVALLTRYLSARYSKDSTYYNANAAVLAARNVFTPDELLAAGKNIYSLHYLQEGNHVVTRILSIPVTQHYIERLIGFIVPENNDGLYSYVCTAEGEDIILSRLDNATMELTPMGAVASATFNNFHLTTVYSIDGRDYLNMRINNRMHLVRAADGATEVILSGETWRFDQKDTAFFAFIWDNDGIVISKYGEQTFTYAENEGLIAIVSGLAVEYAFYDGQCDLTVRRIADWSVVDTYAGIPYASSYAPQLRQETIFGGLYGDFGLFLARNGQLVRVTDAPVYHVSKAEYADGTHPVVVTLNREILVLRDPAVTGEADWRVEVRLPLLPHGIFITAVDVCTDDTLEFRNENGVGMELYDVYRYRLVESEGHIGFLVLSFTPGRPEISYGYQGERTEEWYVSGKQQRLDDLGFGVE